MTYETPAEPTSEQCTARERVTIPGSPDTVAHAVWWPQMGGYVGRAVITITGCPEVWLWHDGQFPYSGDKKPPQKLHLCDPEQWINLFEWVVKRFAEEHADDEHVLAEYLSDPGKYLKGDQPS